MALRARGPNICMKVCIYWWFAYIEIYYSDLKLTWNMEHWNRLEKRLKVLAARFWCSKLKKRSQDMLDSVKIDVFMNACVEMREERAKIKGG